MSSAAGTQRRAIAFIGTGENRIRSRCRRRTIWRVRRIRVANMAARRACLNPNRVHPGAMIEERGQEQPRDKARAQQVSRQDRGGDPPGEKA